MDSGSDDAVAEVFSVRGRPVGFRPSRFGGELIAIERGAFPISSTGYRSLAGMFGGAPGHPSQISPEFLEQLAIERDRERLQLLKQLRETARPVGEPVANYVHVCGVFERALQEGFFASDRDRAVLWGGAHQLLRLVENDPRFQPVPHPSYPAWDEKHCAASLAWSSSLLALLKTLAEGVLPERLPRRLAGVSSYLHLPAKSDGEPKIDLGGFHAEMPMGIVPGAHRRSLAKQSPAPAQPSPNIMSAHIQLGLFDTVAAPTVRFIRGTHVPRISM